MELHDGDLDLAHSFSADRELHTPIPGLSFTMLIPGNKVDLPLRLILTGRTEATREALDRYVRTLILPTRWTQGAAAFLKVVAAMAPSGVRTLVLGGRNQQQAWYAQLWQAWVPATMDPLLKSVGTLVFHEPTREGMHFIFRRRPTGDGPALSETVRTVKVQPGVVDAEEPPQNAWHDLWWDEGMAGDDALGSTLR